MGRYDMRGCNEAGKTDLTHDSGGAVSEEVVAHSETVAALHVLHDQFSLGPGKQDNYHSKNGSK